MSPDGARALTGLFVYPLKGARGFAADSWPLDETGLRFDRRWMLIGDDGALISQRSHPRLTLIRTRIEPSGVLVLSHPDRGELRVSARAELPGGRAGVSGGRAELPGGRAGVSGDQDREATRDRDPELPGDRVAVARPVPGLRHHGTLWGSGVEGRGYPASVDEWVGEALGAECRLLVFPIDGVRPTDPAYSATGRVHFQDGYPLLLIGRGSLDELQRRLADPVVALAERFRPNLIVSTHVAHEEDTWTSVRVGDIDMAVVKPCARCTVPAVHPDTGIPGKEPLRTLALYRRHAGKVYLGQNVVPTRPGTLRVGDRVDVLDTGDARPRIGG